MSFIIHLVAFFCYVKKYLNTQHTIFLNNKNNKKEAKFLFFSHTQTRTLNMLQCIILHVAHNVCFQKQKQLISQSCYI